MSEQTELDCVSCETTFDPSPTGGFCPDCDTPHPEFGHSTVEGGGESTEESAASDETDDQSATDPAEAGSVEETTGEPTPGGGSSAVGDSDGRATEEAAEGEPATGEDDGQSTVSPANVPTHCPECGAHILGDDERSEADAEASEDDDNGELTACPDCGRDVSDEAYCPDCGTDLGAHRDDTSEDRSTEHRETEAVASDDLVPTDSVTLVVNGEPYEIEDGDTFGRADEAWLDDLVVASGGSEGVSYVSSEHIEFSFEDDGVYVTDNSRNGTMHNGTDLDGGRARVEDGDYLTLAKRAEVKIEF